MIDTAAKPTLDRREARKKDRRQAIVDAARASFLENGYAATSMSGLLKTLGGSKATLWGYFRSKEELFAAVVEEITHAFRSEAKAELSLTGDLEATLVTFCRRFIAKISSPEGMATWRLVVAESARFPEVGQIFYEHAARHIKVALTGFIAHHVAAGNLRDDDPQKMADVLLSLCTGEHSRMLWAIHPPNVQDIGGRAADYTDYFLRAFGTAPRVSGQA